MGPHTRKNTIIVGVGAIITLLSLAFPWYALRFSTGLFYTVFSFDISFADLITQTGDGGPAWLGSALPVILVIGCASMALLSIIYSLWEGEEYTTLWCCLGIISVVSIIINAFYLLYWMHNNLCVWVNIINIGVVVAFIGALIMLFSQPDLRERLSSPL